MKRTLCSLLTVALMVAAAGPVQARVEVHEFDDPQQEARYKRLIGELRCLVCQNQNLADSNAELAQDLRQKTYEMIRAGAADQEIIDYMVARYGEFVLYRPPFNRKNLVLWIGPFLILLFGIAVLVSFVRRQRRQPVAFSARDHERAQALLEREKDDNP